MNLIDAIFWWTGAMLLVGVGAVGVTYAFLMVMLACVTETIFRLKQCHDWALIAKELYKRGKLKSVDDQ